MKILYVGPNVNHHQVPFAEELIKHIGESNFLYAAKVTHEPERLSMGFPAFEQEYIINIDENYAQFENWFLNADIVLCSLREYHSLFFQRISKQKLTFYFSERWFKPSLGKLRILHPTMISWILKFKKLSKSPNFYYLAQSQFAADDFKFMGLCKNKIFNFGYFTPLKTHTFTENHLPKNRINLLWSGRMLNWKRPDLLVKAYAKALELNSNLHLTLVGHGEFWPQVEKLINELLPQESYTYLKALPAQELRKRMNEADIYIMPSSGYEGWGAVVNESMNESCALIGSDQVGSVSSMIIDGINGLKFKDGNENDLAEKIIYLASNKVHRENMKANAKDTIEKNWNAAEAAKRFFEVVEKIKQNQPYNLYSENVMKVL